uniref:RYamide n=1 Tax=Carabus violaceus TaxID=41075 RepID=A0A7U3MC99_CARVO|nr:RYamide [Carabus violaceus]
MCVWRVLRVIICVLVIMLSLVTAREYVEKRTPEDRGSWFLGSRYGRSSNTPAADQQQASARRLIVTPRRDDRFHPGSRYGKRTEPLLDDTTAAMTDVQCSYTGIADLYRCHTRKENASGGELMSN